MHYIYQHRMAWGRLMFYLVCLSSFPGSLGFSCTFEDGLCDWTQSTEDDTEWRLRQGGTPSINTGPINDKTLGNERGHYLYYETSSPRMINDKVVLLSPLVQLNSERDFPWCCSFWYNMYGSNIGTLNVYKVPVSGHINSEDEALFSLTGQQTNETTWLQAHVCVPNVISSFKIAFEAIRGNGITGDIAIDDITENPSFICTFEDGLCGWTQSTEDDTEWRLNQGRTSSSNTGPKHDNTLGDDSGHYLYLEASSPSFRDTAVLLSPLVQFNGVREFPMCCSFWYNMYGAEIGTLNVYRTSEDGDIGNGELLFSLNGQQTDGTTWNQAKVCVPNVILSFRIAFEAIRGNDFRGDIAIDDLSISGLPNIPVIEELPNIPVITGGGSLSENDPSTLSCEADGGYPGDWRLAWSVGDTPVDSSAGTTVSASGGHFTFTSTFSFTPRREDNGKTIRCWAERGWPPTASQAGLLGPIRVEFCARMVNITCPLKVPASTVTSISCVSESSNPASGLSVWRNDQPVTGDVSTEGDGEHGGRVTTRNLLQELRSTDSGTVFRCCGSTTALCSPMSCDTCSIIVEYSPRFTVQQAVPPSPITEGDDVVLSCTADANPIPPDYITWERVGSTGSLSSCYNNGTSTLTLRSINREQAGSYRCRADNGVSPVVYSSPIQTIVHYNPVVAAPTATQSGPIAEGDDVVLSCNADANPKPPGYITWERVGSTDYLASVYSNGTSTLTLRSVSREQAGQYRCRADNGVPPAAYSSQINLIVHYEASIAYKPAKDSFLGIPEGSDGHVSCSAPGNPLPTVKWASPSNAYLTNETGGGRIVLVESVIGDHVNGWLLVSTLLIQDVAAADYGSYTCTASNGVGPEDTWTIQIKGLNADAIGRTQDWSANIVIPILAVIAGFSIILNIVAFISRRRKNSLQNTGKRQRRTEVNYASDNPIRVIDDTAGYQDLEKRQSETELTCTSDNPIRVVDDTEEYHEIGIPMETIQLGVGPSESTCQSIAPSPQVIPRDKLAIVRDLGRGTLMGKQVLARASDILQEGVVSQVVIKTLGDEAGPADKENFLRVLDAMNSVSGHANIVKFIGCYLEEEPVYIIVEYLPNGSLKDLLTEHQSQGELVQGSAVGTSRTSLTSWYLLNAAMDVARGMDFLASKKCLHMDLAARSVLVGEDMVCKVSDFGFASDVRLMRVSQRKCQERVPLRWMSLESVLHDVYTTKSDVWSFGVLLWEIVTLGARPYPTMTVNAMTKKLKSGYRMPRPKHCPTELYGVMLSCWAKKPAERSTFEGVIKKLHSLSVGKAKCIALDAYQEELYQVTAPSSQEEVI